MLNEHGLYWIQRVLPLVDFNEENVNARKAKKNSRTIFLSVEQKNVLDRFVGRGSQLTDPFQRRLRMRICISHLRWRKRFQPRIYTVARKISKAQSFLRAIISALLFNQRFVCATQPGAGEFLASIAMNGGKSEYTHSHSDSDNPPLARSLQSRLRFL